MDLAFTEGIKIKAFPVFARATPAELPHDVPFQAAFSVGKRRFRRAVDRNRIKRLMREAWRLHKHTAYAALQKHEKQRALVLIYVGKELPTFEGMQASMQTLIAKMIEALEAPEPPQADPQNHG